MTPSLRKKIVSLIKDQQATNTVLETLEVLLLLMKKFGKQLSQSPIKEFVQKNYPDAYGMYAILGGVRFTIKDCLVIQQHLYESLGEDALVAFITDDKTLRELTASDKEMIVVDGGEQISPSLTIKSPSKIYKRSLASDLQKML